MKRRIIYAFVLVGLFVMSVILNRSGNKIDTQIAAPVLGPDDRAKIIFDPNHHTVTRTDTTGTSRSFLNTHGPVSIVEKKNGQSILIQRTWGTELSPFAGGAFGSDFRFRVALGANGFYVQRWELGGGLLLNVGNIRDTRIFVHVGYNVYSNWLISAALDNQKAVHIIASVRI